LEALIGHLASVPDNIRGLTVITAAAIEPFVLWKFSRPRRRRAVRQLGDAINSTFGSFTDFQAKFERRASGVSAAAGRGSFPTAGSWR